MPRLMLAFFCSGFAALLCQIVWQRMLGIFAGSDTISAALVVGAFLAGLGLGSILGARVADRLGPARALLWFAACEAGVAVCALLSKPFLYDWLALGMAGRVDSPAVIFALCFAGLVLPTMLMGASLPLLSRAVATSLDTVAERIALLYGLNTLGAGLGALAGGWLVVGNLGFVGALIVAAGLNLAAAGLALTLLPAMRGQPAPSAPRGAAASAGAAARFGGLPLWCLLVFLSGYVIVALEIVWVRLLGQVGQYHAYLFPTVLGIFLLADGIGMAVAARMVRRIEDPRPAFFITQGAGFVLAVALIGGLWLALPYPPLATLLAVDDWRFTLAPMLLSTGLILLVVGPPAFLIGMTFPFVQRAVQQDLASVGARVGWVQLANIAGNAAGSIGTGLVTLHILGTMGTLVLLAAVSLLLLAGWLWRARGEGGLRRRGPELALAAACGAAVLLLPSNDGFWRRMHGQAPGSFAAWAEDRSGVAFYREVPEDPEHDRGRFFIMGHSQGMVPFLPVHILLGAIGPLVHPAPERILAIGVGSSGTPWGAAVSPQTHDLRAIELIKPVLDTLREIAAARPEGPVAALLHDPRVRFEYGDGRRLLARETQRYDVIEADAVLPQTSHSGLLYSAEFLEQVRARLAPGGLYVQWAPTARVVETFVAVFPHAVLLQPFPVLIGSNDPIPFDHARLLARLADPAVLAHARRGNPAIQALAQEVAGPAYLWDPETARDPAPLTDMFPRDEFFANHESVARWKPRTPRQAQPVPMPVPRTMAGAAR
ncbi:MAG: spermidine synthase [Acetobacteraceae bacterium]|nr:spermidine synthase [Acetobacteraceae bacterium]